MDEQEQYAKVCSHRFDRIEDKLDGVEKRVTNHLPHKIEQFSWRIVFFVLGSLFIEIGTVIALLRWILQ